MTATVITDQMPYSWGQQTNQAIGKLISLNTQLARLGEAIATASSGFGGTAGTQFEATPNMGTPTNRFGVVPSDTPGEQGEAYRYAMDSLNSAWRTFWDQARPYIEQLDNGQVAM